MSIKKVANIAGVSIATVSRYFNNPDQVSEKTREKVQSAIEKIDYAPNALAQNLRRGKTGLVIAVVPSFNSPIYKPIIQELNKLANQNEYSLLIKQAGHNSLTLDYFKSMLRSKQADGFIILTGLATMTKLPELSDTYPIVLAFEPELSEKTGLHELCINYFSAGKEATELLLQQGHQNIAFIAHSDSANSTTEIKRGYLYAMNFAGKRTNAIYIDGTPSMSLDQQLSQLLESQANLSAIICADDETAMELMHLLKQRGISIPADISVVGFHNSHLAPICDPPLTSIHNPLQRIGQQAMTTLLHLMKRERVKREDRPFEHAIIERKSTQPP